MELPRDTCNNFNIFQKQNEKSVHSFTFVTALFYVFNVVEMCVNGFVHDLHQVLVFIYYKVEQHSLLYDGTVIRLLL